MVFNKLEFPEVKYFILKEKSLRSIGVYCWGPDKSDVSKSFDKGIGAKGRVK